MTEFSGSSDQIHTVCDQHGCCGVPESMRMNADVEDYVGGTMVNGHKISTNPAILYAQKETVQEFLQAFSTLTKREQEFFYYWMGMDRMDIARSRNEMIRRHGLSEAEAKRLQKQSAEKLWKQLWPLWSRIPYFVESTMEDE